MVRARISFRQIGVAAVGVFSAFTLVLADNAAAQSLKEMRARDAEERALQREADFTGRVCSSSISASIDWRSAADWPEGVSIARACDGALSALEAMCRQGRGSGGEVSSFVCAGDGSGADLSGGEFTYGASPGENSFSDAKEVLEAEL